MLIYGFITSFKGYILQTIIKSLSTISMTLLLFINFIEAKKVDSNLSGEPSLAILHNIDSDIQKGYTALSEKKSEKKTEIASKTLEEPIVKAAQDVQTFKLLNHIVEIKIPTVPTPPKAIQFKDSTQSNNRAIKFSKRTPPNYVAHPFDNIKKEKVSKTALVGEINGQRISAYLRGAYMDVSEIESKLKSAGFTLLTSTPINKKSTLISIVFTDKALIKLASKPNRAFMANLRILVDTKEKVISITNPLYMAKGFLQNDFNKKEATAILTKITTLFPKLKNSKDGLKFQLLPNYQFMNGMPKYQDMLEIASGDDLVERIKKNKKVVFTQTLENGATLIGIKLGKRTRKFTQKIGRNNAAMLPYPIVIQNGKAKILDPKFYISYMYPLLQMSEFMTIATIPDAIIKDAKRVFKKKKKK
jgi:hypothetical protein